MMYVHKSFCCCCCPCDFLAFFNFVTINAGYRPPVPHVDEVGDTVEGRHADVRQREVDEEVVGDAPHAAVGCNKQVGDGGGS